MRIVCVILFVLIFTLTTGVVFFWPWLFLPIAAGFLVVLAILIGTPGKFGKFRHGVQITAICVAVIIVVGLWINTPWKPKSVRTSFASRANSFVAQPKGPSRGGARPVSTTIEVDQLSLRNALQMERQRVTLISKALALYDVARMEHQVQVNSGKPDERLSAAMGVFYSEFEKERTIAIGKSIRLLAPEELEAHVQRARTAIDKLEKEDLSNAKDSQALRNCRYGIPNALHDFQLESLYLAVTSLQDSLMTSLRVELSPEATYEVKYDRDHDSLISEQHTRINLSDNPASAIDLTGFFTSQDNQLGANLSEEVTIQEDSSPEMKMEPKAPAYDLRPGVKDLLITKRIIRRNAGEGIVGGPLPIQFFQVRIDWPLLSKHELTLALQERGNSNRTWPFVVQIKNKDDASLNRILMPRNAVYFVDPPMHFEPGASNDELTPSPSAGKLRDLAPDSAQAIRIELLPWYLSNTCGQKIKEYLVVENMFAAVIVFIITVVGPIVFKASWGDASGKPK